MNKKMKKNKFIIMFLALLLVFVTVLVAVGCQDNPTDVVDGKKEYTLTFVTNGGTEIAPITAYAGVSIRAIANPTKSDENGTYIFVGWFLYPDFSGEAVTIPDKMPAENVTYYAKFELDNTNSENSFTIEYRLNLTDVQYTPIPTVVTNDLSTYKTADGAEFGVKGYMFLCWTTEQNGPFSLKGLTEEGQYYANETIVSSDKRIILYAHWGKEYTDARESSSDKIYVCDEIAGKGLGAAILVREGKENKLGFVDTEKLLDFGYSEFTFYFDESEGGDTVGRLYPYDCTFAFSDGMEGEYWNYSYITENYDTFILALDGFGVAIIMRMVGNQTVVDHFGMYEYDEEYGDFSFVELDPTTQMPVVDALGNMSGFYFMVEKKEIEDTFDGTYTIQGAESGSYLLYDNGVLDYNYRLDLNGYGFAHIYFYDELNNATELVASGRYTGAENHEDYYGEWEFISDVDEFESFRFILSYIAGGDEYLTIFIEYDEVLNKTFKDNSGNGDELFLDGYGGAMYTTNGIVLEGNCTVSKNLVVFLPYVEDEDGNYVAGKKLYFNIDFEALTFTVNSEGFIIEESTIINYDGESDIVVIPDGITAIGDNAFNYVYTDVSLVSVTIPESVVSIGKHAFQNGYTLQRVVFLSSTPIDIDWSADYDPFRWGAGNFVIVVPEGSQDAYKAAWVGCKYDIKGSEEVKRLPEFEVVDGVLVAYNKQPDSADMLDLRLPDEVIEIAANVFRGVTFLRSIDFNNVKVIGEDAFYACTSLISAIFTNVEVIGDGAFMSCYNLGIEANGQIDLPKIKTLGASAFACCESLKLVRLGEGLGEIGDQAFAECHVYVDEEPLFVELLGENPPFMGGKISLGNIAFRLKIQNISVAFQCAEDPSWRTYIKHLYIESGAEKGIYMCGTEKLELNGRAEWEFGVSLYAIYDKLIMFYFFDEEEGVFATLSGEIDGNKITLKGSEGEDVVFVKPNGMQTYVSADGLYTLEVNPIDLLPDSYEDTNFVGVADGILNGVPVKINVLGYNTKTIKNFIENGVVYDFTFTLDGDVLVYEKKVADTYLRNIKADDGSELNFHFSGKYVYVFGTLQIEVADGVMMPPWGDYGTLAIEVAPNVYEFTRDYRGTKYKIKVTLSSDKTTFTYEYEIA